MWPEILAEREGIMVSMVANIIAVYKSATAEQIETGLSWYSDALGICQDFAQVHGVTVEVAAGVFAALSPQNSYGANINLARRFLASGGTLDSGYLGLGLRKARDIYNGADILPILNGDKTMHFYRSIISGGEDGVCIDRHAYCIAVGERVTTIPTLKGKRYAEIVKAYERAARALGESPARVQAVTWVAWRQRYWAKGAFDPRA